MISFEQLEEKYQKEVKNNKSLIKMNQSLTAQNQKFSNALMRLKHFIDEINNVQSQGQEDEIQADEALSIVQEAISKYKPSDTNCECERWKTLYTQESQQSFRLSRLNSEYMLKIQQKEKLEELNRIQIKKLLDDYFELFRKQYSPEEGQISDERKKEKRNSSLSKGKSKQKVNSSKTERKPQQISKSSKESYYGQTLIDSFKKDLSNLQKEVEQLRSRNRDQESLIRIYRQKERDRLIYGDLLVDTY